MGSQLATVYIVDDDPSVLKALARIIKTAGYRIRTFNRASAFLDCRILKGPNCLVTDLRMPGISGLELQREMAARNINMPVVFLTGHGDVPSSVEAIKAGALDFLTKPVRGGTLLGAVQKAVNKDKTRLKEESKVAASRRHFDLLSPREYEVMRWVISGYLSKQIAGELGISLKTVKFHRMNVMHKTGTNSVAELTILAHRAGIAARKNLVQ